MHRQRADMSRNTVAELQTHIANYWSDMFATSAADLCEGTSFSDCVCKHATASYCIFKMGSFGD